MIPGRLRRIQKRIHGTLEAQVEKLLGPLPEAIQRYERSYRKDFPVKYLDRAIDETQDAPPQENERLLIESIRSAPITLVGDYHTYAQAQRTALRLLREAHRPGENWWLGVELLSSAQQKNLDAFQRGELTVPEFHARIGYDREWGFPWSHYEPLFQWARENSVRVIALNRPRPFLSVNPHARATGKEKPGERDLFDRDQWAAGIITDLFAEAHALGFETPRMMVLYGELHLGSRHLPQQIREVSRTYFKALGRAGLPESIEPLVVHQNYDPLYWRLAQMGLAEGHPVVPLAPRKYCIFSGTPWGKLQSLVSWAEAAGAAPYNPENDLRTRRIESESDSDSDSESQDWGDDDEDEEDLLGELGVLCQTISEGFEVPAPDLSNLHVCTASDPEFISRALRPGKLSPSETALARSLLRLNIRFHLPGEPVAFLGTPSPNGLAEMAALVTLRSRTLSARLFENTLEGLARHTLECTGAFLGGWFLNPRRKCDLRKDHLARARELRKSTHARELARREIFPGELQARELAAILSQVTSNSGLERELARFTSREAIPPLVKFLAFRYFGQELGHRAGRIIVRHESIGHRIRHLLLARMDGRGRALTERLDELLKLLPPESAPRGKTRIV